MAKFIIPLFWSMSNDIEIESNSLEEAIRMAKKSDPSMLDAQYIDNSYTINRECAEALSQES